jgi:D-serine deaminase-like pyridoxal phosphate-dependent protein
MKFLLDNKAYIINQPEVIHTPRLIVFQDRVESNIDKMRHLLKSVNPSLDLHNLCPHVKTHKSVRMTKMLLDAGVTFFKASLNEIDMLVQAGAPKIFVAYPLLKRDAELVADYMMDFPHIQFFVQLSRPEHVDILSKISREKNLNWHYYVDANIGMNRTGLAIEQAFDFFQSLQDSPFFTFCGLHAYDGHIHHKSIDDRRQASGESMARLKKAVEHFTDNGVFVPNCIVAGTPSFLPDVEFWHEHSVESDIIYSPGTWLYFDSVTNEMMPNTFDYAAVILTQVIDKPTSHPATLNLGHKRWAVDQGPVDTFSIPGMQVVSKSEEHTVVTSSASLSIGDYVMMVPRHVCSTVNLWEYAVIINKDGDIDDLNSPIDGRNR